MKIAVTAAGPGLGAAFVPTFGRCSVFVFVETETMEFEWSPNHAIEAASGAGIQAAQLVVDQDAGAVVTGNVGPNAFQVLASAGVPVFPYSGPTVQSAVEEYMRGALTPAATPTGPAHAGMGAGARQGMGRGVGARARFGGSGW